MRELPTETSGVVSVRPLDPVRHPSSGQSPRATATSAVSGQDASAKRAALKLLRFPTVRERTGLSRSTIWRLEQRGEFPRHHGSPPTLSPGSRRKSPPGFSSAQRCRGAIRLAGTLFMTTTIVHQCTTKSRSRMPSTSSTSSMIAWLPMRTMTYGSLQSRPNGSFTTSPSCHLRRSPGARRRTPAEEGAAGTGIALSKEPTETIVAIFWQAGLCTQADAVSPDVNRLVSRPLRVQHAEKHVAAVSGATSGSRERGRDCSL